MKQLIIVNEGRMGTVSSRLGAQEKARLREEGVEGRSRRESGFMNQNSTLKLRELRI